VQGTPRGGGIGLGVGNGGRAGRAIRCGWGEQWVPGGGGGVGRRGGGDGTRVTGGGGGGGRGGEGGGGGGGRGRGGATLVWGVTWGGPS